MLLFKVLLQDSRKQIFNEINYLEILSKIFFKVSKCKFVLGIYSISSNNLLSKEDSYQQYFPNKSLKTNTKSNNKKSLLIRRLLRDNLDFDFLTFVDPTKTLQKYARSEFIHGKLDPFHFNTYGYKLLANATSQGCQLNVEN